MTTKTEEEVKAKFKKMLDSLTQEMENNFSEEGFVCYMNVVWNVKTAGAENDYTSLSVVSHPDDDEIKNGFGTEVQVKYLAESLTSDPFIVGAVMHNLVDSFIQKSYYPETTEKEAKDENLLLFPMNKDMN